MSRNTSSETLEGVARALKLLEAFSMETPYLGLSGLARRTGVAKTTTLRVLRTLEASGYVVQTDNAEWRLGPAAASLGGRYQMAFDLRENIEPALRELSDASGRDTSFFIPDGTKRVRLIKVLCPGAQHNHARVGDSMPLDRGSPGKVILAALGEAGALYDDIRSRGYHITVGEAKKSSASIAAPVFGHRWKVVGALCIGAPTAPSVEQMFIELVPMLLCIARSLSAALSYANAESVTFAGRAPNTWYPSL